MAPNLSPKKRGGRPRKHKTGEDATKAARESKLRWYHQSRQPAGPADFISYEPPLHSDIPTDTPPTIGLRTSIQIPREHNAQESDVPEHQAPFPFAPTQESTFDESAKVEAQIRQIRIDEQEADVVREDYEAEILQQLSEMDTTAAKILVGLRASVQDKEALAGGPSGIARSQKGDGLHTSGEGDGVCDVEPLLSCFPQSDPVYEPIMTWGDESIAASSTPNRAGSIQKSRESTVLLQTPQRTSSVQSSKSQRSTSRRSTSFPVQRNTLMSWVTSLPQQASADKTPISLRTAISPSTSNAAPSPSSPAPSMIRLNPAPIIPTPTPIRSPVVQASPNAPVSDAEPPLVPAERTAVKLAKQLRNFQGCTHEQHREADQLHQEHHRRAEVHSECSSLEQITHILRAKNRETPLLDVLSSPKLMKSADINGLDYRAAFEGSDLPADPEDLERRDEYLPRNLCLSQCHVASKKNRRAGVTFDIDSTCCFPNSLGVARLGINWFPKSHAVLNLTADIHFGLRVPTYNKRGVLSQTYTPLHEIPHYCFGTTVGMENLLIYIFFPALHRDSDYEHSNYLSKQDWELLYDAILSPALNETVTSSNLMQHYPATARVVEIDSTAISGERLARKDSSREQILHYTVQSQYLDALWSQILETISTNPTCHRFAGATLFLHAKNTKLDFIDKTGSLNTAYDSWENQWSKATDPQFYNKDHTFVDLAKQVTSEDSALPYDKIPEDHEAEVFLWKKCCLDSYAETRMVLNADGSPAKGNPKRSTYPWAMMRDAMGQTFFAPPRGRESQDGLVYSQFYNLIKTPFDTSKVYIFDNEALENLALDPGYVRSLQQEGGGITFLKAVCEFGYP